MPYHPTVLLLWNAHMNLQRITNSAWSFYLLKYAMKCEPNGQMSLDTSSAAKLGLQDVSPAQLKLIENFVMIHPVCPTEAVMLCAEAPIVEMSTSVKYVNTAPRGKRACTVLRGDKAALHPLDDYASRPPSLLHLTLHQYFENYSFDKGFKPSQEDRLVGRDLNGKHVYELKAPRVVRYSEFHPVCNMDAFFFNYLLARVPFMYESELLSHDNTDKSYFQECVMRGFLGSTQDLESIILEYSNRQLFAQERCQAMVDAVYQKLQISPDEPLPPPAAVVNERDSRTIMGRDTLAALTASADDFADMDRAVLNDGQQHVVD